MAVKEPGSKPRPTKQGDSTSNKPKSRSKTSKADAGKGSAAAKANTTIGSRKPSATTRKYSAGNAKRKTRSPAKVAGAKVAGNGKSNSSPSRKARRQNKATKSGGNGKRNLILRLFMWLLLAASLLFAVWVVWLDFEVRAAFSGKKWEVPARVYARPLELHVSAQVNRGDVLAELQMLGYSQKGKLSAPGDYFPRSNNRLDVYSRGFQFPDGEEKARKIRLSFSATSVDSILDLDSKASIPLMRLDPALVGSLYPRSGEDRLLVGLEQLPETLVAGLVATEDKRFYDHIGVDFRGIARAMVANIKAGRFVEGGSTITQQLVKNFYLDSRRTLGRKINEAMMALILEFHYSKNEILEAYINEIYLGQDGPRAVHGFGLASHYYFGKPATELSVAEMATLIGIVKGPSHYNPRRRAERAAKRKALVLGLMEQEGVISKDQTNKALATQVAVTAKGSLDQNRFPDYAQLVKTQLLRDYAEDDLTTEGLQIYTAFDPLVHSRAQKALIKKVKELNKKTGRSDANLQGSAVITSAHSGEVMSLIGSADNIRGGYNRALKMRRPVGSLLKPFLYLTALQTPERYHLGTLLDDSELEVTMDNGVIWRPANYDKEFHGRVPLWKAWAHSYNVASVRLAMDVGLDNFAETLSNLGYPREIPNYPSIALGTLDMSPLEVSQLYQSLASGGSYQPLTAIREVRTASGEPLRRYPLKFYQAFDADLHYLAQYGLYQTTQLGSARALKWLLPKNTITAGKTGTTNDKRDSWYAGYDADKLVTVWLGFDDNKPTKLSGSAGALRVWAAIMNNQKRRNLRFNAPKNIANVEINASDGLRADQHCSNVVLLPLANQGEGVAWSPCAKPQQEADDGEGISNWFRRLWE